MYPNLKLQLWKSGIRQNRLARLLGVDETVLSRIVNGFREPNPDLQHNIAAVLKCDAVWLFSRQDNFGVQGIPEVAGNGGSESGLTGSVLPGNIADPIVIELGPREIEKIR